MLVISLLEHFLLTQLFTFLILFTRIGTCLMIVPAIGDVYVMPRIRLLLALAISLLITPMLQETMPKIPGNPILLTGMLAAEILTGALFGTLVRMILSAMNTAGTIIANQSSLAIASIFEATAGVQTAIVSNFFTLGAIAIFFVMNLHHVLFAAIINSYQTFPAGIFLDLGDGSDLLARRLGDAFLLGVQFSAPHIVMSLIFYLAGGVMSRMMPSFQVFFVMMPPQVTLALLLLIIIIAPMMTIYANYMESHLLELTSSVATHER